MGRRSPQTTKEVLVISKCQEVRSGLLKEFRGSEQIRVRMVETIDAADRFKDRKYNVVVYHGTDPISIEWVATKAKEMRARVILITSAKTPKTVKIRVNIIPGSDNPGQLVEVLSDLITSAK